MHSKKKLAVVGSGVAGLGCVHRLSPEYDVTLFEKNNYLGGHTNTVTIDEEGEEFNIDTGFIVFNHETYPNLVRFFRELEVAYEPSDMSFSVYNKNNNLQYAGNDLSSLFAQKKNWLRPGYWKFLWEVNRFNKNAPADMEAKKTDKALAEYLSEEGYSRDFLMNFIIPMGSAVWSTPIDKMLLFPAKTLIRFFYNHGFLGLNTQFQWYTVTNGAKSYIQKIIEKADFKHKTNCRVHEIERFTNHVLIKTNEGSLSFDKVVIASHADQALKMLKKPTRLEESLLSKFFYQKNQAVLHTDASVMPPLRKIWSSWNYKVKKRDEGFQSTTIYYMNLLQNLKTKKKYFLSVNEFDRIDPKKILRSIDYEHPLFDMEAIRAQENLKALNQNHQIYFCGSYFKYGFHEDAFTSALELSEALLAEENKKTAKNTENKYERVDA